jgi:hypothetical protein
MLTENTEVMQSKQISYLLPDISISLIAKPMLGSMSKVVRELIKMDAEAELRPKLERRTDTPACSRICGV